MHNNQAARAKVDEAVGDFTSMTTRAQSAPPCLGRTTSDHIDATTIRTQIASLNKIIAACRAELQACNENDDSVADNNNVPKVGVSVLNL